MNRPAARAQTPNKTPVRARKQPTTMRTPPKPALLFEVAWEVCSQVGGIYTVLRTKAPATSRRWGDNYCLIGPYREQSARIELEPHTPADAMQDVLEELSHGGLRTHFGRWLVTGRPQVLLIEPWTASHRLNEIKHRLWNDNGLRSLDGDSEFDETLLFGFAVAEFLQTLTRRLKARPIIAHFHEWQAAAALPMLRHRQVPVATVFTTHATLAGRHLSAANAELYEHISHIDAGGAARAHGFSHRHDLEGACASCADVFTTVSGITALEGEHFLGRRADVLLPNGLNIERFAAPHEFQVLHRESRDRIHEFVMGHFFPSYTFDLERTRYVFTSGRYEYRNKGLDVFIEALYELNNRLRLENSPETVVAFIVTRAPYRSINNETLNRQAMFNELRETCESIEHEMGRRLFHTVAHGRPPTFEDLLDEYAAVRLKRMMFAFHRQTPPTIVTHDLTDDANDPVLRHLRHRGLCNHADDRVKVVFHPEFMSLTSPLLGMDYDQFVRGCHLGVFPSYYEPWGYTPLECIVRGIPAITSDLSGFGAYVMEHFPEHDDAGIYVARRSGRPFYTTVQQVAGWLYSLTRLTRRQRIALRSRAEGYSDHFDWNNLGQYYASAYRLALSRRFPGMDSVPPDPQASPVQTRPKRPRTTASKKRR